MSDPIRWTEDEMIQETVAFWERDDIRAEECRVIESTADDQRCLVVLHKPTGRTSDEAADGGRWTLDGQSWTDPDRS